MKEITLRKWHRYVAVPLIPFILLQAISGLFLSAAWLTGLHHTAGKLLEDTGPIVQFWDWVFMGVHYGGGWLGNFINVIIGLGIFWLGVSGTWIYLKSRGHAHKH